MCNIESDDKNAVSNKVQDKEYVYGISLIVKLNSQHFYLTSEIS